MTHFVIARSAFSASQRDFQALSNGSEYFSVDVPGDFAVDRGAAA
jgi:hypothetical protein